MTLLGFKERFVPQIESREKRHTIRAVGESGVCRFKVGDQVQLYRMVRQKGMRKIVDVDPYVTLVQAIEIGSDGGGETWVMVDDRGLTLPEIDDLAMRDGFEHANGFLDFFVPREPMIFRGHIIHWDWR